MLNRESERTVIFSCGHEGTVMVSGNQTQKREMAEYLARNRVCPDCYRREKAAEKKARDAELEREVKKLGLPELNGTEKQVAWALNLRRKFMADIESRIIYIEENLNHKRSFEQKSAQRLLENMNVQNTEDIREIANEILKTKSEAKYWIENQMYIDNRIKERK